MAKKKAGGVNKSQAIRDYYTANPDAKPKEVLEALTAQGVKTNTAFISTIRSNMKKGIGGGKRGRPASSTKLAAREAAKPASSSGEVSIDSLLKAKKVVEEMGGVDEARAAINALDKLLR